MASLGQDAALSREIDRITSSPYPSQLRTLHDLTSTAQCSDISQWAASKPCLVETLASCLLEALQQWPYVLDIITKFSSNAACRNAFLRQEPTLLHSVVAYAVKAGDIRSKYVRASVALLSLPLPDTVALPAEVQTLLIQLVEEAAKTPSALTIEPVYLLLTGTGNFLLPILSTDTLIQLEEHIINITRNDLSGGTLDRCLSFYCLSIMNVICSSIDPEFRLTGSPYSTGDFLASTPTSSKWKAEAMQQFFTGNKAQKSMQLIVILVIWATGLVFEIDTTAERIKSLVLANELITAIPPDLRKNWCGANAIAVRKLQEKLCAEGQDQTIKTLALRFLGKLCELDSLPHPVLESIELTFLEPKSIHLLHTVNPNTDDSDLFSSVLARAPISVLLQNAVDYAICAESTDLAAGLDAVTRVIRSARAIIEEQKITGHEIRTALNEASFVVTLEHLRDLLQAPIEHSEGLTPGWCAKALHRKRSKLAHGISDLLLRACHSSMSPHTMTLLLSLHASAARGDLECAHDRPSARDHVALGTGNEQDLPEVTDWREALQTHFKARASVEQTAVTKLFARACESLEARCEEVEKPLRKEREKRRAKEKQNEELTRAFAELEAKNVDYVIQNRTLEEERNQYVNELDENRQENDQLLARISGLEQSLREAQSEGKKRLAEMNEEKEMVELDKAAALARKEEELEDLQDQLEQSSRDLAMKEQEISALQNDITTARQENEHLHETVNSREARLGEFRDTISRFEQSERELQSANTRLQNQLDATSRDSADQSSQLAELGRKIQEAQAEREETLAAFSREAEAARKDFEQRLEQAEQLRNQLEHAQEELNQQLSRAEQEILDQQSRHDSEMSARNTRVSDLKKKIERLQQTCAQKDEEIAKLEAMRTNLMAAMGLSSTQGKTALPHRSRESMAPVEDSTQPPTPTSGDMEPQDPNEPTPKRSRPRRSIPEVKARAKSMGGKGTQLAAAAARRQTLGVVTENSKVATIQTPTKESFAEDDETTFEGSELFTGTQGKRMVDMQDVYDENSFR